MCVGCGDVELGIGIDVDALLQWGWVERLVCGWLIGCVRGWSRGVLVTAGEREDSRRGLHPMHCKPTL